MGLYFKMGIRSKTKNLLRRYTGDAGPVSAVSEAFDELARKNGYVPEITPTSMLHALELQPAEVIDAGVMKGTPWLYDAFPDSKFFLVEPQRGMRERLTHTPKDFVCVPRAVGGQQGKITLEVAGAKSSFLPRTELTMGRLQPATKSR